MPTTLTPAQQAQAAQLKKDQPTWTDDDVQSWGTRYYGWGQADPAANTGGAASTSSPLPASNASPTFSGATLDFNIPEVETPSTSVSLPASTPPPTPDPVSSTTSPTFAPGLEFAPSGEQTVTGTGTGSTVTGTGTGSGVVPGVDETTDPAITPGTDRTIVIDGVTYTIPGAPTINTQESTGTSPTANTPGLGYAPEDPMLGIVREQLIAMMARANSTPSLDDPTIRPQADAYTAAQERARRGLQADTAEAMSARGLGSSGASDSAMRASYETMGQNIGGFNAKLLSDEQTARRGDLTSALEMANELGMFKEKTALERDLASLDTQTKVNLANLDAQLKTAGLSVQERLGIMDAELKKYGIELEGDMGLLNTVLKNEFDYAQLKVQGDIANLDANVKMQLGALDAQLRREGYSAQERMAALDAEVRKYGIDTQGDLGALDVALRKELGIGQLNLGLLNALLQNQQFNDDLGWDMGKYIIDGNANAVGG